MNIAVIPARGASQRIPRKNIRNFRGKPLIAWSIELARAAGLFEHVIVSTDDAEIEEVARGYGAELPFRRPAALADHLTGTTDVIAHATAWAQDAGWKPRAVCCIYATAPLLDVADLRRGLQLLEAGRWSYAFAATDFPAPIFRSFRQHEDGGVEMFFPDRFDTRSQDLPTALHDAGQFYWGRPDAWTERRRIFDRHSVPVIVPRWRVQDIDTADDWRRAEIIFDLLTETRDE